MQLSVGKGKKGKTRGIYKSTGRERIERYKRFVMKTFHLDWDSDLQRDSQVKAMTSLAHR